MDTGLKNASSVSIILGSLILLGMSYGVLGPSYIVIGLWLIFQNALNTIEINTYTKEDFDEIGKLSTFENFTKENVVIGSIRMILYISIMLTVITFNLFAWQLYLISMAYGQYILYSKGKQLGLNIYENNKD